MKKPSRAEHVASLERGFRVLQTFSRAHAHMTLSEVAALTRLTPATARRSLHTLERLGFVCRTGRRFSLRPRVLALGAGYLETVKADVVVQPYVDEVVNVHGGCASVTVLDELDVVYVAHASATQSPRVLPGARCAACSTATGRVLLAHRPAERVQQYVQRATGNGSAPLGSDPGGLTPILSAIRRKGFAIVDNELGGGMISVAVPILGPSGRVVAAASCSDAMTSVSRLELLEDRLPTLRIAARSIEQALIRHPELATSAEDAEGPVPVVDEGTVLIGSLTELAGRPRTRASQPPQQIES